MNAEQLILIKTIDKLTSDYDLKSLINENYIDQGFSALLDKFAGEINVFANEQYDFLNDTKFC